MTRADKDFPRGPGPFVRPAACSARGAATGSASGGIVRSRTCGLVTTTERCRRRENRAGATRCGPWRSGEETRSPVTGFEPVAAHPPELFDLGADFRARLPGPRPPGAVETALLGVRPLVPRPLACRQRVRFPCPPPGSPGQSLPSGRPVGGRRYHRPYAPENGSEARARRRGNRLCTGGNRGRSTSCGRISASGRDGTCEPLRDCVVILSAQRVPSFARQRATPHRHPPEWALPTEHKPARSCSAASWPLGRRWCAVGRLHAVLPSPVHVTG